VTDGLEKGAIMNPRYIECKDDFRRSFEDAYRIIFTDRYLKTMHGAGFTPDQETALTDLYYSHTPTLANINGFIKKAAKIKGSIDFVTDTVNFLNEIKPIADAMAELKGMIVKRMPKSEEEKKLAYQAPASSAKAVEQTKILITEIVNDNYEALKNSLIRSMQQQVTDFLAAVEENGSLPKYKHNPYSPYDYLKGRYGQRVDVKTLMEIELGVERSDSYSGPYIRRADGDQKIEAKATQIADEIREAFVIKNLKKLTSILEAKGDDQFLSADKTETHISLGSLEGTIRFKFKDGSGFDASNSVVFVINSYGTRFYRFPLVFMNVKLAGGDKMAAPSEKRMNTVFVGKPE
jgi:hypothetical protein